MRYVKYEAEYKLRERLLRAVENKNDKAIKVLWWRLQKLCKDHDHDPQSEKLLFLVAGEYEDLLAT